jgi:hypothetical protein
MENKRWNILLTVLLVVCITTNILVNFPITNYISAIKTELPGETGGGVADGIAVEIKEQKEFVLDLVEEESGRISIESDGVTYKYIPKQLFELKELTDKTMEGTILGDFLDEENSLVFLNSSILQVLIQKKGDAHYLVDGAGGHDFHRELVRSFLYSLYLTTYYQKTGEILDTLNNPLHLNYEQANNKITVSIEAKNYGKYKYGIWYDENLIILTKLAD